MMQFFSYLFLINAAFLPMTQAELLRDYGVVGTTFEILEDDLLEIIESKLKRIEEEGNLEAYQKHMTQKVVANIKRPKPDHLFMIPVSPFLTI